MSSADKAETMLSWLKSQGGFIHPSTAVKLDTLTGLSLFAKDEIQENQRLVSCPFGAAITPEVATSAICEVCDVQPGALVWPAESSKAGEAWNDRMRLSVYMCLHWFVTDDQDIKISTSTAAKSLRHKEYIASLPSAEELTTPLFFTEQEMELLKGTNMYGAVQDRQKEWQEEASVVGKVLGMEGFTWKRYLTAATYISSRAFPSKLLRISEDGPTSTSAVQTTEEEESHPVMLPGLDLLNHARGQPITWLSSKTTTSSGTSIPSISLVSSNVTPPNTQLFNNYGPKPNEELLLGYGFVIPSNPDDTVILKLGSSSSISPEKSNRFKQKSIDPDARFHIARDGVIPQALLEVLRILLTEEGLEGPKEGEEDEHVLMEFEQKELELELDVLGTLGSMLDSKLVKIEEGIAGAQDNSSVVRVHVREMCDIYRQGQIDILTTTMDKISDRIERLEKMVDSGMTCSCCL